MQKKEEITKKKCCSCKEEKDVSDFYKDKTSKDGFTSSCKKCTEDERRVRRQSKVS